MFWNKQNRGNPQSLNSYSYADDNPITRSDPGGKIAGLDDLIASTIGGVLNFDIYTLQTAAAGQPETWAGAGNAFVTGSINFASGGNGTSPHLSGELFNVMAGVRMVHVPYRGGAPASLPDLFRGQVHAMFDNLPNKIEYIRTEQLRALAVTSATRWPSLPDIPTVAEFLPGYDVTTWMGFSAPKRTPIEIIDKLNKEINAGLINPKIKARLAELGGAPLVGSPADFGKFIADETEKWAKVIRAANIKAE
jgi:tripartite-type tricarboxylate transporter receptor subunit TctC